MCNVPPKAAILDNWLRDNSFNPDGLPFLSCTTDTDSYLITADFHARSADNPITIANCYTSAADAHTIPANSYAPSAHTHANTYCYAYTNGHAPIPGRAGQFFRQPGLGIQHPRSLGRGPCRH